MTWTVAIMQIVSSFLGTFGFGVLFNIRGKRLVFASIGGMFAWTLYLVLFNMLANEVLCYFLVSLSASIYAEIMARVLKTPAITFSILSLIPLVPGSSLYYSIASVLEGSAESFFGKLAHTLSLAAALSLGIILVAAFSKGITYRLRTRIITKIKEEP